MPCKNKQCLVDKGGKCVEGFSNPAECPRYANASQPTEEESSGDAPEAAAPVDTAPEEDEEGAIEERELALSSGAPLDLRQAGTRMRATGAHLVAIVGATGSGKTTLVSSIYDLLGRKEAPKGFEFVSSDCLSAFESLCHLARAASGRVVPDTEHTSHRIGLTFLHLGLLSPSSLEPVHVLFSDRSGEDYQAAMNDRDHCKDLIELGYANTILLLIDAEKLKNRAHRNATLAQARLMVESWVDADLIQKTHRLVIALTKLDLIKAAEDEQKILESFDQCVDNIRERLGSRFGQVSSVKVASRPIRETVPAGTGLKEVLDVCCSEPIVLAHEMGEISSPDRTFLQYR